MLGRWDRDRHAHGRGLHPRLPFLLRESGGARAVGSGGTGAPRAGGPRAGAGVHRGHVGESRRPPRRRRQPFRPRHSRAPAREPGDDRRGADPRLQGRGARSRHRRRGAAARGGAQHRDGRAAHPHRPRPPRRLPAVAARSRVPQEASGGPVHQELDHGRPRRTRRRNPPDVPRSPGRRGGRPHARAVPAAVAVPPPGGTLRPSQAVRRAQARGGGHGLSLRRRRPPGALELSRGGVLSEGLDGSRAAGRRMPELNLLQAVNDALRVEMKRNPNVVVLGEDIGKFGGVFRATAGLYEEFGPERVIDTPLAEGGIIGAAIGMALYGLKPVPEIQFADFIYPAYDQIVNELAKFRYRSGGQYAAPVVIRTPYGGGIRGGHYHSQSPEAYFAHTPGLKVVIPSNPYDAKGLLLSAIRGEDPVIFMEPKRVYRAARGEVPTEDYTVP